MGDSDRGDVHRVTGTAAQQGREVAQSAKAEASQVTDTAKDQARQVKDEVAGQARGLVDQAKSELRDQGRSQADHAAQSIRRVADQAEALAEGRPQDAGAVADYVRRAGGKAREVAGHVEQRGIEGVMNDVQDFARRKPGAFLLGCAAAGFVAGRLIRGGAASSHDSSDLPNGSGSSSVQQPSIYQPTVA
jgi:gas vesicle protein